MQGGLLLLLLLQQGGLGQDLLNSRDVGGQGGQGLALVLPQSIPPLMQRQAGKVGQQGRLLLLLVLERVEQGHLERLRPSQLLLHLLWHLLVLLLVLTDWR